MRKRKIGIIGVGVVGGALARYLKEVRKIAPIIFDPPKGIGAPAEINKADIVFIAVPTPIHKRLGYGLRPLSQALEALKAPKTVVIKSTILPGTTQYFQRRYPSNTILFNPEFLRAKSAYNDFCKPDRQIIGYASNRGKKIAPAIFSLLPKAPFQRAVPSGAAEAIKCFANAFLATKVIFANQVFDFCHALGINYDAVRDGIGADRRIGPSHLDVFKDGYRGFAGTCLPKDLDAILVLAKKLKVEPRLFLAVRAVNKKLLEEKGMV